jgi:hypothetical protein
MIDFPINITNLLILLEFELVLLMKLELGRYKHSKSGKTYIVLGVGRHSETLEEFVVYQAEYYDSEFGNNAIWIRPVSMFLEKVTLNGEEVSRFQFIG